MGKIPTRRNHRLTEFDYSRNGAYFVTICTKDKQRIFWDNHTVAETSTDKSVVGAVIDRPNVNDEKISDNRSVGAVIGRPYEEYKNNNRLNQNGLIIKQAIEQISQYYKYVFVDKYVIMPNHVHILLRIEYENGAADDRPYDIEHHKSDERILYKASRTLNMAKIVLRPHNPKST